MVILCFAIFLFHFSFHFFSFFNSIIFKGKKKNLSGELVFKDLSCICLSGPLPGKKAFSDTQRRKKSHTSIKSAYEKRLHKRVRVTFLNFKFHFFVFIILFPHLSQTSRIRTEESNLYPFAFVIQPIQALPKGHKGQNASYRDKRIGKNNIYAIR